MNNNKMLSRKDVEKLSDLLTSGGFADLADDLLRANDEYFIRMGEITQWQYCDHKFVNDVCTKCNMPKVYENADLLSLRNKFEQSFMVNVLFNPVFKNDNGVSDVFDQVREKDMPQIVHAATSPTNPPATNECKCKCNAKRFTDHLGNVFNSRKEAFEYWHIPYYIGRDRIMRNGWSIEKALTTPVNGSRSVKSSVNKEPPKSKRTCYDHKGNEFKNVTQMCDFWGVTLTRYYKRLKKGWSLEECLVGRSRKKTDKSSTEKTKIEKNAPVCDHVGQSFVSVEEMCAYWGIDKEEYKIRIKAGRPLEYALTGTIETNDDKTDWTGTQYLSRRHMCEHYNADYKYYLKCLKRGMGKKKAMMRAQIKKKSH